MKEVERVPLDGDVAPSEAALLPRRQALADIVASARRRLGLFELRRAAARHAALLCAAAAVCAASRPFVWALHDGAVWKAMLRAALLAVAGTALMLVVLLVAGWRKRPSLVASARRLDDALGLAEVVASGFAFERDGRTDEMASFATERARRAVLGLDIDRVLVPSRSARSRTERRRLAGAVAAAVLGLAIGGIDRLVVERMVHPLTDREASAAAELKKAAEHAAANAPRGPNDEKDAKAEAVLAAAKRASEAAQRGDRRAAQEALDEMRKASRALEADHREQARSLRSLRDELEGASARAKGDGEGAGRDGTRPARPSATASEALAKLKKELESSRGDKETLRKMIERLERAESAARAASEKASASGRDAGEIGSSGTSSESGKGRKAEDAREAAWSRAAAALKEAREAAARGDSEAAKRAMERAERELAALEKASDPSRTGAISRVADHASELDRSMFSAMSGAREPARSGMEGGDGAEPGRGKEPGGAGTNKAASKGPDDPSGTPGAGPGGGDRTPGAEQRRVKVSGDLQARTDVREGERAVSVLEGMGRGGDPKAYREIFPSYDTVVEDGLREDTVPAARRPVVRRYFSSIRPGTDEEESRKRP